MRKKDRITIIEREKEAAKKRQEEMEIRKKADERRRQTLKVPFSFSNLRTWKYSKLK